MFMFHVFKTINTDGKKTWNVIQIEANEFSYISIDSITQKKTMWVPFEYSAL